MGIVCIQQARSHDAITHRSAFAILRDRIGWRLQPIGVVLQTYEGKLSVIINGRNSAIACRTSYSRSINDTSLIVQQEVSRKVFYVLVIVLIRCVSLFCCFLNLTEVRTVGLERQCDATHRISKLCHASVKRLVELIGTFEGNNERRYLHACHTFCVSLIEIKDVTHISVVQGSTLHRDIGSILSYDNFLFLLSESTVHFLKRTRSLTILFIIHNYLIAREAIALGQRQRHVVNDRSRCTRRKHQATIKYGHVVSMLLHHTAFHQITLVRGNKRHGQLVVDPYSTKTREVGLTTITCSRNDITRLRADADCLGGCRHSHRQQNCSCGASDHAPAT